MNGLVGMITGSGRVWVLSGLWVSRPTITLALRPARVGWGAGPGQATQGEEGRPAGPPAGFGPLG
jgi:hypothetical protein